MTRPPDDGRELPRDSEAAEHAHDRSVCVGATEVALRHEAAVTALLLRRLEQGTVIRTGRDGSWRET